MDTRVRDVTIDDAPEIVPLLDQLGYPAHEPDVRQRLERLLSDEHFACWGLEDGSPGIIGLAAGQLTWHLELDYPVATLSVLVVDEHYRGRGYARSLTDAFEDWGRLHGARVAALSSGNRRHDAHRVYENLGWTATGKRFRKGLHS